MKSCEIHLGYFKQGDDLHGCIQKSKTPADALLLHSQMLIEIAKHLVKIHDLVGQQPIELDADAHHIGLIGPDELVNELIKQELADAVEEDEGEEEAE